MHSDVAIDIETLQRVVWELEETCCFANSAASEFANCSNSEVQQVAAAPYKYIVFFKRRAKEEFGED